MNYIHDGLLLHDNVETLERCVSMYSYWLRRMKASNFEYNLVAMPNLPEWFFEHTESLFATILGVGTRFPL